MRRTEKHCREWWWDGCVISPVHGMLAVWCARWNVCMYQTERDQLSAEQLEVLDAWSNRAVCPWPEYRWDTPCPWLDRPGETASPSRRG